MVNVLGGAKIVFLADWVLIKPNPTLSMGVRILNSKLLREYKRYILAVFLARMEQDQVKLTKIQNNGGGGLILDPASLRTDINVGCDHSGAAVLILLLLLLLLVVVVLILLLRVVVD